MDPTYNVTLSTAEDFKIWAQTRPVHSAGASLTEAPELQQLALNFLATFLVVTLINNVSRHCPRSSAVWAIYIALF